MQPCLIVDPLGKLTEHYEILSAKIQLSIRTTEVKTTLRGQLPFRIFSPMTLPFDSGERHQEYCGSEAGLGPPEYGLSRFQFRATCRRHLDSLSLSNRF